MEMTATMKINELIRIMNDEREPAWKRSAARNEYLAAGRRAFLMTAACSNSEEYPYDTILDIVRRKLT